MFPSPALAPEERARLKAEHAHRFPRLVSLHLPGDHGEPISLDVVIGIPTGACALPPGQRPSPAWSLWLRAFMRRERAGDVDSMIAADCLLWPDRATWAGYTARWSGLAKSLSEAMNAMMGGSIVDGWGDTPPAPLAASLAADPRAAWYYFDPPAPTRRAALVLAPPAGNVWRRAQRDIDSAGDDIWKYVRALSERCVAAAAVETEEEGWLAAPITEVIDRSPGLAVLLGVKIGQAAGAAARIDLGEL